MTSAPLPSIVHVISSLRLGGAQLLLWEICRALQGKNYHFVVVSLTEETPLANKLRSAGCTVHCLNLSGKKPWKVLQLSALIKRAHPLFVHTWLYHADLVGGIAARAVGVPVIWSVHHASGDFSSDSFALKKLVQFLSVLSRYIPHSIIYCSAEAKLVHEDVLAYNTSKSTVIENGVNFDRFKPNLELRNKFRQELGVASNAIVVGVIGRFAEVKGQDVFFETASIIRSRVTDPIVFIVVGTDIRRDNPKLQKLAGSLLDDPNLYLLGERPDIDTVLNGLDILVCPSRSESFGLVVIEALACGVCVLASDLPAMRHILEPDCLAPIGDAEQFADKILTLAKSKSLYSGTEQLHRLEEKQLTLFSQQHMIKNYRNFYEGFGSSDAK